MTDNDKFIRLKLLGYECVEFTNKSIIELHFVASDRIQTYNSFKYGVYQRPVSDYIYDCKSKKWLKERFILEEMPLTPAEKILYGE